MTRGIRLLAVVALVLLGAAACSKDQPTVSAPAQDEGVTQPSPEGSPTDDTMGGGTGGDMEMGTGELPTGWPADFPLPDGSSPVYSFSAEGEVAAWFSSDKSADELEAFFTGALPGAGWDVVETANMQGPEGSFSMLQISSGPTEGTLVLGEGGPATGAGFGGDFAFYVLLSTTG